jgi:cytochrome c oxidase assembly protein subunit 17
MGASASAPSAAGAGALPPAAAAAASAPPTAEAPKKKKICCACPETKAPRDACIGEHGPEGCAALIEAHNRCLRKEGFNV